MTEVKSDITEIDQQASGDVTDAWGKSNAASSHRVACMPVEREALYYKMNHRNRGMAIILNHEHFDITSLKQRTGTNVDCINLKFTLEKLGFEVIVHTNKKVKEVMTIVTEAAKMDHSDCDCFVLAVLSHGEMGILYSKDSPYKPDSLWSPFTADKCPTLAGKPKLFFLQACQGDKLDGGITLRRTEVDGGEMAYKIPVHADFLIAYSTVPGYYSWRNTTNGSWFMQALCCELQDKGFTTDILTLLTFVIQRVALDFESNTPGNYIMHQQKQIPCVTTMLTRLLQFTKK